MYIHCFCDWGRRYSQTIPGDTILVQHWALFLVFLTATHLVPFSREQMENQSPLRVSSPKLSSSKAKCSLPVFCKKLLLVPFSAKIQNHCCSRNQPDLVCMHSSVPDHQIFFAYFCSVSCCPSCSAGSSGHITFSRTAAQWNEIRYRKRTRSRTKSSLADTGHVVKELRS